ncbi:DUF2589 domain-containing protein [Leptothrix ochracea]|jgi:hypothetical protein|uniref:DUF2589 domain-containing protein n=1 Tax=Leptothrix ochracea TaxID=735331 RepID=UPI0034E1CD27
MTTSKPPKGTPSDTPMVPSSSIPTDDHSSAALAAHVGGALQALQTATGVFGGGVGPLGATPSTDLTSELNNIDFKKMIGGPLQAAVDAQVASSMASINFIKEVGFQTDASTGKSELVMVDFSHTRKDVDKDGNPVETDVNIKVPLLAMVQIPSLRIEHVIIDFNVKLNSVESSKVSDKLGIDASVSGGWGPVNFKVSASYQRQSTTGVEVKKEYALNVNVKAVQDEIPLGLEKILNMLAA